MEYAILDLETTGFDPENSSIIEVGVIIVEGKTIKDSYSSFVAYSGEIPETVKRITGITEEMLRGVPSIQEVIPEVRSFIGKRPVVSHNGFSFDFQFLEREGMKLHEKYDSMEFAFFVLPTNIDGHSVSALAGYFGLPNIQHRALADCQMEFAIIQKLQEEYGKRQTEQREALKALAERTGWWWANFLPGKPKQVDFISTLIPKYEPYRKQNARQEAVAFEPQAIDPADVQEQFIPHKTPSPEDDYSEDRPEQKAMAAFVAETFNSQRHAVIEVGTGTGKSKAYLVPALLFALKNEIPMIVSTHTKALQDQLYAKEIPHLKATIHADLRVAVLKGKKNYVCLRKFEEFSEEITQGLTQRSLYESSGGDTNFTRRLVHLLLASWITETERGDWDEIPYWLKEKMPKRVEMDICNIDELCGAGMCELYDSQKCFLAKARSRARDADIVIVNHAIALSGIVLDTKEIKKEESEEEESSKSYSHTVFPGEAKFIIFDEAHHLEDDATSAWEHIISDGGMQLLLQQLYGKSGAKNLVESMVKQKGNQRLQGLAKSFEQSEGDMKIDVQTVFRNLLPKLIPEDENPENTVYCILDEIPEDSETKKAFIATARNLAARLRGIKETLEDIATEVKSPKVEKILQTRARAIGEIVYALNVVLGDNREYVKYLERTGSTIELKAAPLSVAPYLKEYVYDNFASVILASATLTIDKSFQFFAERCGTSLVQPSKIGHRLFKTSFDYTTQCKFFVPKGISYSGKPEEHLAKSIPFLERAIIASGGGALVLCSSHRQVDALYERLERPLARHNIWLLRQSKGSSSNSVIRDFRKDINSTLIGTKTLWQGIDIPGESLRSLFIFKIPYDRPDNPLIKARCRKIDAEGGRSFAEYYEPLAALAIKQGFGRLIRKTTDTGVAILLDEELLKKHRILGSLPEGVSVVRAEPEEIFAALNSVERMPQEEKGKSYSIATIRKTYPMAYGEWTPKEEVKLKEYIASGKSVAEISKILGRDEGGIRSRLRKLGAIS